VKETVINREREKQTGQQDRQMYRQRDRERHMHTETDRHKQTDKKATAILALK
jgi:hypothetical protein